MKSASEWVDNWPGDPNGFATVTEADIRKIQADALRYAANLSGAFYRAFLIDEADRLDPPIKHETPSR